MSLGSLLQSQKEVPKPPFAFLRKSKSISMKAEYFDSLSFVEQVSCLINYGDLIMNRWEHSNLVGLYRIDDFYAEIHYKGTSNLVDKIETLREDSIISTYFSNVDLTPLYSPL